MKFLVSHATRHTVIQAESWHDARCWAAAHIADVRRVELTGEHAVADVELRWVGTDAGARPNRRLQVRKRGGDWE